MDRITVRYTAEGTEAIGRLKDVSRAGVFVRGTDLPRPGAVVVLQFRCPSGALVDVRGQVRWNTDDPGDPDDESGFGVLIPEPSREYLDFLRWVMDQTDDEKGDDTPTL